MCLLYKDKSVSMVTYSYLGQKQSVGLYVENPKKYIHRAAVALSTYVSYVYLWQFELPVTGLHLNVLRHIHFLYNFLLQVPISKVNVSLISLFLVSGNLERPNLI